ncbi:uncharacterized protein EAE97_004970 [Botrytis byssoidea]|uniref:DUF1753-domain-containing protein n=1 Tax=Botrytis byssoidea TaxID=139641 RepID=A0A9P5IQ90_9HELO|nr:uncharacterized protein EAE97_004970 [Botrytis byssoidea]KAF7945932.1 hypothetical protein EAE97_004970 [Botrytis byssoidea]
MLSLPQWVRVPRPRTFLYLMTLRTGTEMISLSMIFNKVTGFYGLLAVLAGLKLSPLQLSMYIYSVAALALTAFLMPHIRKQTPFQCLALAWFYLFDTIINTAFTTAFAVTWLLAVSADQSNKGISSAAPGGSTIDETAGFTSPKFNVSAVNAIASPASGAGQDAVAYGTAAGATLEQSVGIEESVPSIIVVGILTLIRVYFILVVMAYARQVLRQNMYSASSTKLHLNTDGSTDARAENPFAIGSPQGQGWKGELGRLMVKVGEGYWLGGQVDEAWVKGLDGRFKTQRTFNGPPGTIERERRARSGTGPPVPAKGLGIGKL